MEGAKVKPNRRTGLACPVVCARILGYLLLHAPSPGALGEVVRAILSCGKDVLEDFKLQIFRYDKLLQLGLVFRTYSSAHVSLCGAQILRN